MQLNTAAILYHGVCALDTCCANRKCTMHCRTVTAASHLACKRQHTNILALVRLQVVDISHSQQLTAAHGLTAPLLYLVRDSELVPLQRQSPRLTADALATRLQQDIELRMGKPTNNGTRRH